MNKKIAYLLALITLFCLASPVLAQQIPNFLGVKSFYCLLLKIAGGIGNVVAALGTIMIIWAGILYLTSAGSPEKIGTAKKALMYAIIGIVIGAAASGIVSIITTTIGANGGGASC